MSDWVVDKPPTVDEVGDDEYTVVTTLRRNSQSKSVTATASGKLIRESWGNPVRAWLRIPDAYVPPKPERREVWVVYYQDGIYRTTIADRQEAERSANGVGGSASQFREVMDGDPTPEAIAVVRQALTTAAESHDTWAIDRVTAKWMLAKLNPAGDKI